MFEFSAGMKRRRSLDVGADSIKRNSRLPALASVVLLFALGINSPFIPDNTTPKFRRGLIDDPDVRAASGRDAEKIKQVETLLRRFELDTDEDKIAEEKTQGTKDPLTIRKAPVPKVDLALDDQRQTLQLRIGNYSYTYTYISRFVKEMRNSIWI